MEEKEKKNRKFTRVESCAAIRQFRPLRRAEREMAQG